MAGRKDVCVVLAVILAILTRQIIVCNEVSVEAGVEIQDEISGKKDVEFDYEEESTVESVGDYSEIGQEESLLSKLPLQEAEENTTPLPVSTGSSRAPTLQDILSGADMDSPLPPHLQLSFASNMSALNLTSNLTADAKKIICRPRNVSATNETDLYVPMVKLVTSKELLNRLSMTNDTYANCIVVMFYAPWCPFCAKVAPHFNALPKVFPQLDFMAIDAINFNNLNARFGTTAVPNLLFFHKSKVVRFNSTIRTIESMAKFISNITSLEFNHTLLEITDLDYVGPLSSVPTQERDYLLWLSWIFIIAFSSYMFSRSHTGLRLWNYVNSFGAVHEHHHID